MRSVRSSAAAGALLCSLIIASGALAEPPAETVDDYVAGSMRVTTGARDRDGHALRMAFGSHLDASIELQYRSEQTAQGMWGWVQLIVPVVPGVVPLSVEAPDVANGIGYIDWGISGAPDPRPGCEATWSGSDGVIRGSVTCPRIGKGKRAFRFAADYVAEPVDAWRTCLPGFVLADAEPAILSPTASIEPTASIGPSAAPVLASASPSAGWPAPEEIWSSLDGPPACVPGGPTPSPGTSPEPPLDACGLLTVDEVAGALAADPATIAVDASSPGWCRYLRPDGYGAAVLAGRGANVLPPRPMAGAGCSSVELDDVGVRGLLAGCTGPSDAWSVGLAGAVTDEAGMTVVIGDPSVQAGILGTRVQDLLALGMERLP